MRLYPVSDWARGEIVADVRSLPLHPGQAAAAVLVGVYDLATGQREAVSWAGAEGGAADAVRLALDGDRALPPAVSANPTLRVH